MNLTKIILSICAIMAIAYFSYCSYEQEKNQSSLKTNGEIFYAKILELKCGKHGSIKFKLRGQEIVQRIYLSSDECNELKISTLIGLKIDKDENIVFANDSYNDWSEAESISILLLGIFFIFCIAYYGIVLELKK